TLDEAIGVDARLRFEIRVGTDVLSRRSIYVEPDTAWPRTEALVWCDRFGELSDESVPLRVAGALVYAGRIAPFSDWVAAEHSWKSVSDVSAGASTGTIDTPGTSDLPPVVTFLSEAELRHLITPWRQHVAESGEVESESLSSRPGGRALTEGAMQYL